MVRTASVSKAALHIPSLDGLRAVGFLLVFLGHAGLALVPSGFGATVFFFLSGYLITTLMRVEFERTGTVSARAFYLRRVLRIFPPFYLVLTAATVLTAVGVLSGALSAPAVVAQLIHTSNYWIIHHGYGGQADGTGVYWSLAVEAHFYLLFPWLYLLLRRLRASHRRQAVLLWALCGAVLAWRVVLVYGFDAAPDRTYLATDTRLDSILFGAALAVYGNPVLEGAPPGRAALWKWGVLPGSLGLLALTFLVRDQGFRETARYSVQGLALTGVFLVAIHWPAFLPFRLLNTRPVAFLGVLSYSLYLTHQVALFAAQRQLPAANRAVQGAVALAASLAVSVGIWAAIERPLTGLRGRLSA